MMLAKSMSVYAIYDIKGKRFDVPFFAQNDLFASRRFMIDCRGQRGVDTMIGNFSEDFELYRIAEYIYEDGSFNNGEKKLILKGTEVDKQ